MPGVQDTDKGPAFTVAGRHAEQVSADAGPGPGEYATALQATGAAFTMAGKHDSTTAPDVDTPGPGEYHAPLEASGGPAYTMAARHSCLSRASQCAQHACCTMLSCAHWTNHCKHIMADAKTPLSICHCVTCRPTEAAPGEYHFEPEPEGPAFTMAGKHRSQEKDVLLVGPGEYDVAITPHAGPAWTMPGKHKAPV